MKLNSSGIAAVLSMEGCVGDEGVNSSKPVNFRVCGVNNAGQQE